MVPIHPQIRLWMELSEAFAIAAETGSKRLLNALHRHDRRAGRTRRPGSDTPMWNVCAALLRGALKGYGEKAKLARYLGIPRQRLNNYLNGKDRLPDAELVLRLLYWLSERRAGRNSSL